MPPRRCFPRGSSEAGFHGILQGRRGGASRGARPRRLSTGFSNGGAARSAAVPFCPSLPRRPAVLLSLPSARTTMPHEHIPVHANRRAVPTLFHIFPARPSRASSFTLPPGQRYRARSPKQCLPKGSSKAAFCGVLQGRRGDASRWARLRRLSTGFSNAAAAVLPDGLVQGGFLRAFPRSLRGSSEAGFCGVLQGRRGGASRWARLRRLSTGFSNGGAARSAAVPFCPSFPRRPAVLLSLPSRPAIGCRTSTFPFTRTGGQSLPFSAFSRAPESCFFLYPAARPTIPRTVAAAMLPDGLV